MTKDNMTDHNHTQTDGAGGLGQADAPQLATTDKHAMDASAMGKMGKYGPYTALLVSLGVSFVVMYLIMYSMVDRISNVYFNLSNVYMTGLMAGSMLPIMLATMRGMFINRKMNAALWVASAAVLAIFWGLLRNEAGVGDRQFLRAMIPHHAAAIQMAKESSLSDPRVKKLGAEIITSQEKEIAQMKALLAERK